MFNLWRLELKCLYSYGKQLGLAFQVVDDILDFTSNDKQLGKPACNDLASGYLTAPALYAIEENNFLSELIERQFSSAGDLDNALQIVRDSEAIPRARKLAEGYAESSCEAISWMPDSTFKTALLHLPEYVLGRLY